ncbi:hypothetical protein Tco_0946593 [Tanacetum coccineum]
MGYVDRIKDLNTHVAASVVNGSICYVVLQICSVGVRSLLLSGKIVGIESETVTDIAQKDEKRSKKNKIGHEIGKSARKPKPKAYSPLMDQPVPILLGQVNPLRDTYKPLN